MGTSAAIRLDTNGMHSTWKATAAVGIAVCLGVVSCGGIRVTASFGAEPSSESPIGVTAPSPELVKAQAERLKAETDSRKASDARLQFFLDWGYRVGLSAAALVLLVWLIPQVAEITLPWGGGTLSVKRAPKERLPEEAYAPPLPAPVLTEATEILKKTLMPGPTTDRMVDRLEEAEVYQRAGVKRDEIYVCHHAKKAARKEYYRVRIYLDAESPEILDKVEKVVYRLHPTFRVSERTQTNRTDQFELEIEAWGEFMLYASIYFNGVPRPVELKRYLNF